MAPVSAEDEAIPSRKMIRMVEEEYRLQLFRYPMIVDR